MTDEICWVVTDDKPGMVSQALGLAEAVGLAIVEKRISVRAPWRWLPPHVWVAPFAALARDGDRLARPWPRLLIGCGRMSVPLSIAVRRASAGRTFTVQIQNPAISLTNFDLVVPPRHDGLTGDNVIVTRGALHRVTAERLRAEAERHRATLEHLPRPLVTVLVGGTNAVYRLTPAIAADLGARLARLSAETGAGLAVTPSRRTGAEAEAALRQSLGEAPAVVWDGSGENPYFGYLGLADFVVATCDSVSMVSEACATGKPVYVVELEGGSAKFRAFHDGLHRDGLTRPFEGRLEAWDYAPLDDTASVAAEVRRRLQSTPRS
jgi:mitochondrial fission protein ELM1